MAAIEEYTRYIADMIDLYVDHTYKACMADSRPMCSGCCALQSDAHDSAILAETRALIPKVKNKVVEQVVDYPACNSMYEVTLTTTVDDPKALQTALERICASQMYAVKHVVACIELTEAKMPHIHALIYSDKKYCDGTKVKLWYPYRYEFKKVRSHDAYHAYIMKEKGNEAVINYCARRGVSQFINKKIM